MELCSVHLVEDNVLYAGLCFSKCCINLPPFHVYDDDDDGGGDNNNGLFDLAATAGLETQSTYIIHTEHKKIQSVQCSATEKL